MRIVGILLALTGLAHLVVPKPFEAITKPVFPDDTAAWVKRNGITEAALGVALVIPRTRRIGLLGVSAYVSFLGKRAAATLKG